MLTFRRLTGLFFLLFSLAVVAPADLVFQKDPERRPRPGGTLLIKAYQTPFNPVFDPAASSHYFVIEQLYDGLVKFDNNFLVIPSLAEYWTISGDGKRITFYLRKGVKFHHGREMTAADVKFSLERLVQNRPGNVCHQYFTSRVAGAEDYWRGKAAEVSGFKVLDPTTFEIQWTRPYVSSLGLNLLSMYYCKILPKDLLEAQGSSFFQRPVGTGPFKFAYWLRSRKFDVPNLEILGVRLERNYQYFGKKPYLDALEYSPYFSDNEFEAGDVHIIPVTSAALLEKKYQILENNSLRSAFLALSCHVPPLDRAEVRRALSLGLNKSKLAEAASTASTVAQATQNYIPTLLPGFFPKDVGPVYEPEKARMLLARLLPETGGRLTLTLVLLLPRRDTTLSLSRELGRELDALGIDLEVKSIRSAEDIRSVRGPYLKFLEWNMDFPDPENVVLPLFGSRSLANELNSHYANSRLDALLEQSEVETSWERRTGLFRQMEQILFEEVPSIPLYTERIRIALLPRVHGAKLPALGFYFLDTNEIWLEEREGPGET
jgi:peptide/nickel transport system substrate-binding protein/oligopeptide transport system substrate-binding protein